MFTGCGTALVTPFRHDQSLDEDDAAAAGAPADRGRHQFPGAVRHHRRKPHADARRASARGRDHARRGRRQSARAGRRGRLQHPRSDRTGARAANAWARTASSPSRLTTTSPRRKACTSTTRPSPPPSAAHRRLQRAGAHRRERRAGHAGAPGAKSKTSSASRKLPATSARWPTCMHEVPPRFHRAFGRRCHHHSADGAGRPRHHLGGRRTKFPPR